MAAPPSTGTASTPSTGTAVSPLLSLVMRLLTSVCLIISLIILVTNSYTDSATASTTYGDFDVSVKVKFSDYYVYRYLLAATVIGLAYIIPQTVLSISSGNRVGGESMRQFDFYGDKVISYILATGAAASFGLTVELKRSSYPSNIEKFLNKAAAASSLCLLGFLFCAISSIFSSLSLPKRV